MGILVSRQCPVAVKTDSHQRPPPRSDGIDNRHSASKGKGGTEVVGWMGEGGGMLSRGLTTSEDQKHRRLWGLGVTLHPRNGVLIWKLTPNSGTFLRGRCRRTETMVVHVDGNGESKVQGSCCTIPLGCWVCMCSSSSSVSRCWCDNLLPQEHRARVMVFGSFPLSRTSARTYERTCRVLSG